MRNERVEIPKDFRKRSCPECGSNKIIEDPAHGRSVCAECGHVKREI
ncbi:MAG: TFIIB-type zinc ribbon-containing protein [Candidatus Aenigmatarchaeota archaeon]